MFNVEFTFFTLSVIHVFTRSVSAVVTFATSRFANVGNPAKMHTAKTRSDLQLANVHTACELAVRLPVSAVHFCTAQEKLMLVRLSGPSLS